jgi:hypothetical protein
MFVNGALSCPGRGAAWSTCGTVRRRAGAVTNAGVWYGPGSAKQPLRKSYALHRARDTNRSFNNRNMLRSTARRRSVKARIIGDLDLTPERAEARALIERQRRRMIEGAGVHPDA